MITIDELNQGIEKCTILIRDSEFLRTEELAKELLLSIEDIEAYTEHRAELLLIISQALWRRGLALESMPVAQQVLALATKHELRAIEAEACNHIGIAYRNFSDFPQALEYLYRALALYEETQNRSMTAGCMNNIGLIHAHLKDHSQAIDYYNRSIEIALEINAEFTVSNVLGNLGNLYLVSAEYQKALEYYTKALSYLDEEIPNVHVARHYANIGCIYYHIEEYQQSMEYFTKALSIDEKVHNIDGIAYNLGSIGNVYGVPAYNQYNPEKAEEYLQKALEMYLTTGVKESIAECYQALATLWEQSGDKSKAYDYFMQFYKIEKEIIGQEASRQARQLEHRRKIEESERDRQVKLARFQEQEKILHNILPSQIADRMIEGEKTIADSHEHVSVFFSDIVGFTKLSQQVSAQELVGMLNGIFTQFDQLARKHGLEKIKTIGDAYMAVCGAPIPMENHAERTALFALDVAALMNNFQTNNGDKVMIRIGLHTGSVVAGIIGENKFAYDMWGDAVNTASRMESHGEAGKIHVSEEFKHAVETQNFASLQFIERGEIDIKGKGLMKTYFLEQAK